METFAKRLCTVRQYRKFTQRKLATDTGLSISLIQQYEYGKRNSTDKQIKKLAAALQVPPEILMPRSIDSAGGVASVMFDMLQAYQDVQIEEDESAVFIKISKKNLLAQTLCAYEKAKALLDFVTPELVEKRYAFGAEILDRGMSIFLQKLAYDDAHDNDQDEQNRQLIKENTKLLLLLEADKDFDTVDWKEIFALSAAGEATKEMLRDAEDAP